MRSATPRATGPWSDYKNTSIKAIREKVGDGKILLALSGGVDSSVAAALLAEAVGDQLTCVFVDHGLMRKNEGDEVEEAFCQVEPQPHPHERRGRVPCRAQGSDRPRGQAQGRSARSSSAPSRRWARRSARRSARWITSHRAPSIRTSSSPAQDDAAVIKSHHNVGGLPDFVDFKEIIEPLRMLFKDEVRQLGLELGLPKYLVYAPAVPRPRSRHPHHRRDHQGEAATFCARRTRFSVRRSQMPVWTLRSTSISPF